MLQVFFVAGAIFVLAFTVHRSQGRGQSAANLHLTASALACQAMEGGPGPRQTMEGGPGPVLHYLALGHWQRICRVSISLWFGAVSG